MWYLENPSRFFQRLLRGVILVLASMRDTVVVRAKISDN